MNILSSIFSVCFLLLGGLIWIVAMLIILTGSIGVLIIFLKEYLDIDVIKGVKKNGFHFKR